MGQVLHGSATTTEAVRRAIQRSEASVRALARRYSISPTTVQKWRKREAVTDKPMGPTDPHSPVLSIDEEAIIVTFRRHSLLPLDDCLYARKRRNRCQGKGGRRYPISGRRKLEYPSWSSPFRHPFAVIFDQNVCQFDELSHQGNDGDFCGFSGGSEGLILRLECLPRSLPLRKQG